MILVAGGTSTLGTQVVRLLTGRGRPVRVLTRDPARAAQLLGTVETLTGDVRDPATVAAAVRGCTTVVSAVHGFAGPGRPSPESVDRDGNRTLIQAATAAGAEHMVLVSMLDAAPGPGRNPISFVSARDVAAVVDLAVHDPSLRGQVLEVAGPERLTFTQLADRLVAATGRPGRVRHIPLPMLRAMSVLARPVVPVFARQAQAAVVMNTTDMTADGAALRARFAAISATTLDELLRQQPPLGARTS